MIEIEVSIPTIQIDAVISATIISSGGNSTVENSDLSFDESILCGSTLVLEDISFVINVNGVLNQSFDYPSMKDLTINIS